MCAIRAAVRSFCFTSSMPRLSQVLIPIFLQPLGRHRKRRAQLLREERDAQLLDQPAELLELRVVAPGVAIGREARLVLLPKALHRHGVLLVALGVGTVLGEPQRVATKVAWQVLEPLPRRDRKSTRLNSSHSQISYAVFCLKKKKI